MSDTPKTDAAEWEADFSNGTYVVEAEFAKILEREIIIASERSLKLYDQLRETERKNISLMNTIRRWESENGKLHTRVKELMDSLMLG